MKPAMEKCAELIRTGQIISTVERIFQENPSVDGPAETLLDSHHEHHH